MRIVYEHEEPDAFELASRNAFRRPPRGRHGHGEGNGEHARAARAADRDGSGAGAYAGLSLVDDAARGLSTRLASGLTRRSFPRSHGRRPARAHRRQRRRGGHAAEKAKRSTSADTSGRRVPARVLSESHGSIAMASRCARATGGRSTTSAGWSTARAMRSTRTVTASSGPTARRASLRRPARVSARSGCGSAMGTPTL